jgi:hypothetical protein
VEVDNEVTESLVVNEMSSQPTERGRCKTSDDKWNHIYVTEREIGSNLFLNDFGG